MERGSHYCKLGEVYIRKLNILIPHNLEIVWGLVKPKDESATFKKCVPSTPHLTVRRMAS
jgi:hypothetical protein